MNTKFEFADRFGFEEKFDFLGDEVLKDKWTYENLDYNSLVQFVKQNRSLKIEVDSKYFLSNLSEFVGNEEQNIPNTKLDGLEGVNIGGRIKDGKQMIDFKRYTLRCYLDAERNVYDRERYDLIFYKVGVNVPALEFYTYEYNSFTSFCDYIGIDHSIYNNQIKEHYFTNYEVVRSLDNKYTILSLMPEFVIDNFSIKHIKSFLVQISRGTVSKIFGDDQDAIYNLLKALAKKSKRSDDFLKVLIFNYGGTCILSNLISKLNDFGAKKNLTEVINLIYGHWLTSTFQIPILSIYNENDFGSRFLPYRSEKTLGFYHSNLNVDIKGMFIEVTYEKQAIDIGVDDNNLNSLVDNNKGLIYYHPFFPLSIPSDQDGELKLSSVVPAFFLYVKEDKDFWHNVRLGAEITLDVLSIFTGVLAVRRFTYLISLANRVKKLGYASKGVKLTKIGAYLRLGGGIAEMSSGGLSAFLKLFDVVKDKELKKDLHDFLMILEIISISTDLPNLFKAEFAERLTSISKHRDKIKKMVRDGLISEEEGAEILKNIDRRRLGGSGPHGDGFLLGKYSGRQFNPDKAGGPILNLDWKNIEVSREGIDTVRKHLSRFEDVEANRRMIKRLEDILEGKIKITDYDKRFYTHEIREYKRYKSVGVKDGVNADDVYNDLHTATLEDYKLNEFDESGGRTLYHPDVKEVHFFSDEERKLLGL